MLVETLIGLDQTIGGNFESLNLNNLKNYNALIKMVSPAMLMNFLPRLQTIGKLQLLRRLLVKQIHFAAKVECHQYSNVLETLNSSVLDNLEEIKENAVDAYCDVHDEMDESRMTDMNQTSNRAGESQSDVQRKEREAEAKKVIKGMLTTLTTATESLGIINPMNKVYALTRKLDAMPYFFAIYTLHALGHMRYDPYLCSMMRKNTHSAEIQPPHFMVGMITLFKQFHPQNYRTYILLLSHFFKNIIHMQT